MTDYLEPQQGENENALWEAVRRLEERTGTTGKKVSGPAEETAGLSSREEESETTDRERGEAESLLLPLLEEMETLDRVLEGRETLERAQTAAGRETASEAGRGRGGFLMGTDPYRGGSGSWVELPQGASEARPKGESTAVWTDDPLQAERLDQVFRRDSRRYDGGFFLY